MGDPEESHGGRAEAEAELDFFLSYARPDERWAEWIAWQLEADGYRIALQKWDFGPGSNFVQKMHESVSRAKRTVLVLSPAYLESEYAAAEWLATFRLDPTGKGKRLLPIRVKLCKPEGLLGAIVCVDLTGHDLGSDAEAGARHLLLEAARGSRSKPAAAPDFPGREAWTASKVPAPFPGQLPAFFAVPHRRNPFFAGRAAELEQLSRSRRQGDARAHVICGLGGIGKTGLAVEYAYREASNYDAVLWVVADSPENLTSNLAALTTTLELPERSETEDGKRVAAVRTYLVTHRRWLLVLDSTDSEAAVRAVLEFLPPSLLGHVLITSRRSDWSAILAEPVHINALTIEQGADFLVNRTQHMQSPPGTSTEAENIAGELGGLPLALEQAAAYVEKRRVTFAKYIAELKQARATLFGNPVPGATDYKHTVASSWLLSKRELGVEARAILSLVGFYSPDEIPRDLFARGIAAFRRAVAREGMQPSQADVADGADHGIIELADYSLVKLGPQSFSCHPLLLAVLRDGMKEDERLEWAESALDVLKEATRGTTSPDDARSWQVWDPLHVHVATAVGHDECQKKVELSAFLMNELGMYLVARARFVEAEACNLRALQMTEALLGPEDPRVVACLGNLAALYFRTNRVSQAEALFRRALKITQAQLGQHNPKVATHLGNLGALLMETRRYSEAEPLLREAARIDETSLGPQDPSLANRLNSLGRLLQDTDRLPEAESHFRRALDIAEASFGDQHPLVATLLNNYARVLEATGRLAEAETLFGRALQITETFLGPHHPDVAIRLNNLAHLLHHSGRLQEAEPLFQRALDITQSALGPDHPTVANRLHNVACLLTDAKRLAEAESLSRRALVILLRFHEQTGHEHRTFRQTALKYHGILRALHFSEDRIAEHLANIRLEVGR